MAQQAPRSPSGFGGAASPKGVQVADCAMESDDGQGRGPTPDTSPPPGSSQEARNARQRRLLIIAMAVVAGALSVGLAVLRVHG